MKRIRIERWGSQFLSTRAASRPLCPSSSLQHHHSFLRQPHNHRPQSTAAFNASPELPEITPRPLETLPSPHPSASLQSAKLSALHARLSLPPRFPLQTLARALVHQSADQDQDFNNVSLSILGANLLGYYTTEYLLCNYPRLPMSVVFAAQYAYVGPKALATIASEWGVEAVAEPGGEVDPGLLQFRRLASRAPLPTTPSGSGRPNEQHSWRRSTTSKIIYDNQFGDLRAQAPGPGNGVPLEEAAQSFVRALIGATYLHCGRAAVQRFYRSHFLSRHLDLATLFDFRTPTRDLSRLCAREGFEPPVARLESETGRKSRHPVFVVGVYSGKDKLGEGAGGSLDEARVRAAAAALKSWYLYRPMEVTVPSSVEGNDQVKWIPNMVDCGEVIV